MQHYSDHKLPITGQPVVISTLHLQFYISKPKMLLNQGPSLWFRVAGKLSDKKGETVTSQNERENRNTLEKVQRETLKRWWWKSMSRWMLGEKERNGFGSTGSLLFRRSKLISGGVKLLHPVAAFISAVFQLLLQRANWSVHPQPLCLDPCLRLWWTEKVRPLVFYWRHQPKTTTNSENV